MSGKMPIGVYPSMPIYVGDWFGGRAVKTMTVEQQGAYINLLLQAWPTSAENLAAPCTLPDDDGDLAHLSGLGPEKWAAIGGKVRAQFPSIGDGLLRNAKQYAVYTHLLSLSQKRSAAGKTGMEARWSETPQPELVRDPKPTLVREEPPEFVQAWELWLAMKRPSNPRKLALKAWEARINEGATPAELLDATKRYLEWVGATGKAGSEKFLMAATFYGPNERWKETWVLPSQATAAMSAPKPASALDRARERWTFYNKEGLTVVTMNYRETLAALVERGEWPSIAEAEAELKRVRPWDIARTMRDATDAVFRVAQRLGAA